MLLKLISLLIADDSHRRTSRESKALIKTYSALYFPNRFSCQKSRIPRLRVAALCDSQTDDPCELFPSARYHIVTESTWLGILYPMFGARRLLRRNRLIL